MIPPEIIEQIAAANDIVEVIGSYFPLKRMGPAYKALCPFHTERTPSFTVNPQRQIFKCFGCGAGGSVFRFVMDYEHIEFIAAVRKLAEKANIQIPDAQMSGEDLERADLRRRVLALHAVAAEFFHTQLMRGKTAEGARDYLKKRGLSAEVAKSWKIGFSPESWDALLGHAQREGFNVEELEASGLFAKKEDSGRLYDRFRGRVMFPICNDTGEVIAFSGRVLNAEQSPAKYVNSPETLLFTKGAVLFGLNKSKRALIEKKQAIVCEGQIDLITAFENGVQNVIAPQGTAFTERQARILKRYVEEVVLCFDADAAGEKAAERSLPQLLGEGLLVRCAEMPPGEDPDSLIRKHGGEAFAERIGEAKDFFDFQIARLSKRADFSTPRGRAAAAEKLTGYARMLKDGFVKETLMSRIADVLEIGRTEYARLVHTGEKSPTKELPEQFQSKVEKTFAALLRGIVRPKNTGDTNADGAKPPKPDRIELPPTHQWLVLLALRHAVSRAWLQAQPWERVLDDATEASALLVKILDADLRPDDNASLNSFFSTLGTAEEAALCSLLERPVPPGAKVVAEDCWHELERRDLTRRRQSLETRLHAPGLTAEEQAQIHQQVLELHRRLSALPPSRPPKPVA